MDTLPTVPALLVIPSLNVSRVIEDAKELAALTSEATAAEIPHTVSTL